MSSPMKNRIKHSLYLLLLLVVIYSCSAQQTTVEPLQIAISKAIPTKNYQPYINWLHQIDSTIICIDMYGLGIDSALSVLQDCDGFLLTGGEDVNPYYYGKELDTTKCDQPNTYRDSLDMALISIAMDQKIPIMGICRGMQILNVSLGGTLIFDIPTDFDTTVKHRYPNYKASHHDVKIKAGSILSDKLNIKSGNVYSNHHQGIEVPAPALNVISFAGDGLPEAIEYKDRSMMPFLLAVQWHPEQMDYSNPLSGGIAKLFVKELSANRNKK